ncbi:carbon-nitrogen hydrolase family protein [Verrucomicrobiota bacterium]
MRTIRVALVQFDAKPEAVKQNLHKMAALGRQAAGDGARWIVFHEGTVCDYTPRLTDFGEHVPSGPSTQRMISLARQHDCFVSFGLSEVDAERYFISQVFVGPAGLVYHYRKSWLWREPEDKGYRNEWARYDPGSGPELFTLDGVEATCFICADGEAPRCIERAKALKPDVVFYPNNRGSLPDFEVFGARASAIGAPMLVTNRTGLSWVHNCKGGSVVYSARGEVLAKSNRQGEEDVLIHDLQV